MSSDVTLGFYTPSYNRYDHIRTYKIIPTTYVVRKSQEQAYLDAGIKPEDLWAVEDELISDYEYVFEYIVENSPEDVICIMDDDIDGISYCHARQRTIEGEESSEPLMDELVRTAQLLVDLDLGLAISDATVIPYTYRGPFRFTGIPGSTKIINKKCIKAKMDSKTDKMVDIDYVMQEVLHNRIVLKPTYYTPTTLTKYNKKARVTGSSYNVSTINASAEYMKAKWGTAFDYIKNKNRPKIMVRRQII